jgi:hypothetical protein
MVGLCYLPLSLPDETIHLRSDGKKQFGVELLVATTAQECFQVLEELGCGVDADSHVSLSERSVG